MKHQQDTAKKAVSFCKEENLDFQELLLLIRNFGYDDLEVFYEKAGGKELAYADADRKFDTYALELIAYFERYFVGEVSNDEYVEYITLKDEMKNMLLMASYYAENNEVIMKCLNFMFESYSESEMDFRKRLPLCERFKAKMTEPIALRDILERYVIVKIEECENAVNQGLIIRMNKECIAMGIDIMKKWFDNYKSDSIARKIENCDENVKKELQPLLG